MKRLFDFCLALFLLLIFLIPILTVSFVGPRPTLFNQDDLIKLRIQKGVHEIMPGLTGWAQINGRDDLSINEKIKFDEEYLQRQSFVFDIEIFIKTFIKVIRRIRHLALITEVHS